MKYYLNNSLANNGVGPDVPDAVLLDARTVDYEDFFASLSEGDEVVLIGGDGTINYLINHVDVSSVKAPIYFLGNGSGNDFLNDIGEQTGKEILLTPYLSNLPWAEINGKKYRFINCMGFGLDGYVCEQIDLVRKKKPSKKISYTAAAVKGLIYDFKPCHAWLEIDGTEYEFDDVWLAPAMKGKYFGGGMMAAPDQDRTSHQLTAVICTCRSRLKMLKNLPSIFKGDHVKKSEMIKIFTGNRIRVRYSRPCAVTIDGEPVSDITEYRAWL